jgi:hypothetical protein
MSMLLLLAALSVEPADFCKAMLQFPADEAKLARYLGAERSRKAEPVKAQHNQTQIDTKTTIVYEKGEAVIYQWPGGAPRLVELRIRKRIRKVELPIQVGDRDKTRTLQCDPEMGPSIKFHVEGGRVRVIEWSNWPD